MADTPFKRYHLHCPTCGEKTIAFPADTPEEPFCNEDSCANAREPIDLDVLLDFEADLAEEKEE